MLSPSSNTADSLSLALDARLAIKALNVYRKDGISKEPLKKAIGDAVGSLRALKSGDSLFDNIASSSPYESYSQIQTLLEVQSQFADENLVERLEASLGEEDPSNRATSIDYAINFFAALENRALKKYNQSFGFGT
jgi:hypothetical protein